MIRIYELRQRKFTEEGRDGTKRSEERETASFFNKPS
jgi:hypothetical protein